MKLINKTKNTYQHSFLDEKMHIQLINLEPDKVLEVDDKIAKKWLKINGIEEFVDPQEAKEKEEALKAANEKLKEELAKANEKLKEDKKDK